MKKPALAIALVLAARSQAALDATVFVAPPASSTGSPLTVIMQVSNNGSNTVTDVAPVIQHGGSASASIAWGPVPAADSIPTAQNRSFTWVYSTSGCGSLVFSGSATGTDTGAPVTSDWDYSLSHSAQCTPSPTPTITPTHTETPWIVYVTRTIPEVGDATILGNVFHPLLSPHLELRYDLPFDGKLSISIYNRIGQLLRRIEKDAQAGRGSELWDGRSDSGSLAGAGIYMAHFRAKGLSKVVKFVVVK